MSSEDEFGGYNANPPSEPKTKKPVPKPRPVKHGASTSAPKVASSLANLQNQEKKPQNVPGAPVPPDVMVLSSDEEPIAPKAKPQPPVTRVGPPTLNGKIVKSKGKAKADLPPPPPTHDDSMEVDEPQATEVPSAAQKPTKASRPTVKSASKNPPLPRPDNAVEISLKRENEKLQKMLEEITGHRNMLAEQIQELVQVRETEPERMLREQQEHFEVTLQGQNQLVRSQSIQLAKYKELQVSGNGRVPQFLSREAANEEKKHAEKEIVELRARLKEREQELFSLKEENKQLKNELAAETEMAKKLQATVGKATGPQIVARSAPTSSQANQSEHTAAVIQLYEDLTNFLIRNVRYEPSSIIPDQMEAIFTCVFTVDVEQDVQTPFNPSLTFLLRLMWEKKEDLDKNTPITSLAQLDEKVQYVPQNLEHEPQDFRKRLDFFNEPFMFARDQLHVFMKTMSERLLGITALESEDEREEQDSIKEE